MSELERAIRDYLEADGHLTGCSCRCNCGRAALAIAARSEVWRVLRKDVPK